jgi:hypothetical protein
LSYPQAGEPRPEALPPAERTVGQLVAETIRLYGDRFALALLLGLGPALLAVVIGHVSVGEWVLFAPLVAAPILSASYVGACVIGLRHTPAAGRLVSAWAAGWIVLAVAELLVFGLILPALAWLAAVGLVVPVLVVEERSWRASFSRAWQLARADYVHALGSLATLAILVFLSQTVLAFLLRGAAGTAISVSYVLANIVLSPVMFLGAALLYTDQAARVKE